MPAINITVNDIDVDELRALKEEDGAFGCRLSWELNGGRARDDGASYTVNVYRGGEKVGAYPVTADAPDRLSGSAGGMKLDVSDKTKTYTLTVVYSKGANVVESGAVDFPVYGVTGLKGKYLNGCLYINWDGFPDKTRYIFCDVYRDNGLKQIYEVSKTDDNIQVRVPEFAGDIPLNADVYATDGNNMIFGVVQKLRFFPSGISLTSFDRDGDSLSTEFNLVCSETESKKLRVRFCIVKDGVILHSAEPVAPTVVSSDGKGNYSFKAAAGGFFTDLLPSLMECSSLGAVVELDGAETAALGGVSCLPLAAPALAVTEYLRDGALLEVGYPSGTPAVGFSSGGKTYYSSEISVRSAENSKFGVRPVFRVNDRETPGISSVSVNVSHDFYSVGKNDGGAIISFCQAGKTDGIAVELTRELFYAHLTESVSSENNIVTLEPGNGSSYTLKIADKPLDSAELNDFYAKLFDIKGGESNSLTPEGFYLLRGAAARSCSCALSEVLAAARNFVPTSRCCGILPGDVLRVETSVYVEQTNSNIASVSGYTLSNTAEYRVALGGAALVFDPFVSGMSKAISSAFSAESTPNRMFAGAFDLSVNAEFAYLFLVYPINYYTPDLPASERPSENVSLMGGANFPVLLDAVKSAAENPRSMDDMDNVYYFNGRSAATVLIRVFVNGAERLIPVGTTVYALQSERGAYGGFKLSRLNASGEYCPVFVEEGVSGSEIALLSGDRLQL